MHVIDVVTVDGMHCQYRVLTGHVLVFEKFVKCFWATCFQYWLWFLMGLLFFVVVELNQRASLWLNQRVFYLEDMGERYTKFGWIPFPSPVGATRRGRQGLLLGDKAHWCDISPTGEICGIPWATCGYVTRLMFSVLFRRARKRQLFLPQDLSICAHNCAHIMSLFLSWMGLLHSVTGSMLCARNFLAWGVVRHWCM